MSTEGYDVNQSSQSDLVRKCEQNFYLTATIQGRLSYLLMSIHAVTPSICARLTTYNPGPILFYNMLYGVAAHLHCRPHMQLLGSFHRVAFSILGSIAFNHSCMMGFQWVVNTFPMRPYLRTFMGFFVGRLMMVYFLAYMYHVDSRSVVGQIVERDANYESMYL
ncbi:hypothetical protein PPYR_14434 [Photinus pyralis]|uniref:Transmembrane protein n=1 Tax=Photinus pyralis TaxID=7054 RepID=A0A5N4A577_PHOPY|nr:uncharacterized protein LOC116181251 isoform X1 [Photinus pyralis]KAB0792475.1 hypothetical protein PPYR_14434 [Photinus pyralis]